MRLRYPEGVRSEIDADLSLTGRVSAPMLSGTVTVQNAVWTTRFDTSGSLFDFSGGRRHPGGLRRRGRHAAAAPRRARRRARHAAHREQRGAHRRRAPISRSAAPTNARSSSAAPKSRAAKFIFEGRRYLVTRGTLDFTNPVRIEPTFDIAAETQVRVPGQTYRVTLRATGTMQRLRPVFTSDPPLPAVGDRLAAARRRGDVAGRRSAGAAAADRTEQQLIQARAARLLASPISGEIGKVVEETFGVDTFQLTPLLCDPTSSRRASTRRPDSPSASASPTART